MTTENDAGITKLMAAYKHVSCAIRLTFDGEDAVPIYTLAHAGFTVLKDLLKHRAPARNPFAKVPKAVWDALGEIPNALKHADRDPDAIVKYSSEYLSACADLSINSCNNLATRLGQELTPEMKAHQYWLLIARPAEYMLAPVSAEGGDAVLDTFHANIRSHQLKSWEEKRDIARYVLGRYRDDPQMVAVPLLPAPDRQAPPR